MLQITSIVLVLLLSSFTQLGWAMQLNRTFHTYPSPHPDPEFVAQEVQRRVNASISRRETLQVFQKDQSACFTGNPIDDCWKCDPDWPNNRQRLADCAIGFGQYAMGGKNGEYYIVTDSSDDDAVNPKPGTLRYAVIQEEPLWIVFPSNMLIKLKQELIFNSFKTLDGRGASVHIEGGGCITLQYISNIIIHNIHIHHCVPSGNTNVRSSPTHFGYRTKSDGDGISIFGAKDIWIDHFQRMPRCRRGYIHVVNNDFTEWEMYAIGGSGHPTINSQGNRYVAPSNPNAKEVTKRLDSGDGEWKGWNWRSEGDVMVNGAFFVSSGEELEVKYEKAYSVEPKSVDLIGMLTLHAGALGVGGRENNLGMWSTGPNGGTPGLGTDDDYSDDNAASGGAPPPSPSLLTFVVAILCFISFHTIAFTSML
ncbi:Probable pectate lyase 12 [Linum perenne]